MAYLYWRKASCLCLFILGAVVLTAGCGSRQTAPGPAAVQVKAMQVMQRDTPLTICLDGCRIHGLVCPRGPVPDAGHLRIVAQTL